MWLAVDVESAPAVGDDAGVRGVYVFVFVDEMGAEDGGEEFGGCDRVLLCEDEDGVLDRVGCDDDAVVCFGVSGSVRFSIWIRTEECTISRFLPLRVRKPSFQRQSARRSPRRDALCRLGHCPCRSGPLRRLA